jgi:hypothetical protein
VSDWHVPAEIGERYRSLLRWANCDRSAPCTPDDRVHPHAVVCNRDRISDAALARTGPPPVIPSVGGRFIKPGLSGLVGTMPRWLRTSLLWIGTRCS